MNHEASQYLELSGPNNSMEIEAVFSFTFVRGCAAHYGSPTYAGHPAESDSLEDLEVKAIYPMIKNAKGDYVRGLALELTPWLSDFCLASIREEDLIEEVCDDA